MSIRKSLMHYFDKASSKHIPFHPQTESAAITDWHESIIKSLASKVLPTVVSELTTDSVMGKLIKMLLNASGVKYSIDTNGYVCLGSFFGGLIIQWGQTHAEQSTPFNIAFPRSVFVVLVAQRNSRYSPATPGVDAKDVSLSGFFGYASADISTHYQDALWWISIGV